MSENKKRLVAAVKNLPSGSWWKKSTEQKFVEVGTRLLEHGVPYDVVIDTLQDLYYAVSEEFGQ